MTRSIRQICHLSCLRFWGAKPNYRICTIFLVSSGLSLCPDLGAPVRHELQKKVGRSLLESFDHGVWFVDLTGVFRDSGVAGAVSRVLGILEEEQIALSETIARQLAKQKVLLVLDNCEQFVGGCAEFAEKILTQAPESRVLATSREPLHISGEFVWQVPPLTAQAGVKLFLERARQTTSDFASDSSSDATIREIVKRLDGVPLAIELAAARTSMMGPDQILAGLDKRFDLLTGGVRDATIHHKSLWASVAWSYDLMVPAEQALARQLSVLRVNGGAKSCHWAAQ